MKVGIKNIAAWAILLTASLPIITATITRFRENAIQESMRDAMKIEHLVTVRVPEQEMHWIEENREVKIDGKFFDVESFQLVEGYFILHGLFDDEETALFRQLEENRGGTDQQNTRLANLFHLFETTTVSSTGMLQVLIDASAPYHWYTSKLYHSDHSILTPPPRG